MPNANGALARFLKDYEDINFIFEVAEGTIQNTFLFDCERLDVYQAAIAFVILSDEILKELPLCSLKWRARPFKNRARARARISSVIYCPVQSFLDKKYSRD